MTWLGLEDKVVLVTGAASGIGKSVVEGLLEAGANVIASDINDNKPEYKDETDNNLLYVHLDVTDRESIKIAIDECLEKFGHIDAIVNNAGINIPRLLVDPKDPQGKYELDDRVIDLVTNLSLIHI